MTFNRGINAEKRHQRALRLMYRGAPGGWKKASKPANVRARLERAKP